MGSKSKTPNFTAGTHFSVEIPSTQTIDMVRAFVRAEYGLEVHIRVKIGPRQELEEDGQKILRIPIEAIDDPFLKGSISQWPQQEGHYVLIGYFT